MGEMSEGLDINTSPFNSDSTNTCNKTSAETNKYNRSKPQTELLVTFAFQAQF